jgi:hypothetical protein
MPETSHREQDRESSEILPQRHEKKSSKEIIRQALLCQWQPDSTGIGLISAGSCYARF